MYRQIKEASIGKTTPYAIYINQSLLMYNYGKGTLELEELVFFKPRVITYRNQCSFGLSYNLYNSTTLI